MAERIRLEGNTFGHLHVKEYIGNGKYHCLCECGNECDVLGSNLRRGHTVSCGHVKYTADLTGKVFGNLKVIKRAKGRMRGKAKRVCWLCKCLNCGKIVNVFADSLTGKYPRDCECSRERHLPESIKREFVNGTQISKLQAKPTKANKSGVVGVNWDNSRGKWQAAIRFQGHKYNLGRYSSFEAACQARKEAEIKYFGDILAYYKEGENKND